MTKTTNFQLNQWDGDDRIMREDFNADNAKIDAAIAAGCRMIKLREIVTAQTAHQVDLDVSDIVWGRWQEVILDITPSETASLSLFLCKNNTLYSSHYTCGFEGVSSGLLGGEVASGTKIQARLLTFRNSTQTIASVAHVGYNTHMGYVLSETFATAFPSGKLSLCGINSNYDVPAGTKVEFYGVNA